jgi:phosphopantetheine adenylyltransferase
MQISSRLVREIASLGGPVAGLVAPSVEARLTRHFAARSGRS